MKTTTFALAALLGLTSASVTPRASPLDVGVECSAGPLGHCPFPGQVGCEHNGGHTVVCGYDNIWYETYNCPDQGWDCDCKTGGCRYHDTDTPVTGPYPTPKSPLPSPPQPLPPVPFKINPGPAPSPPSPPPPAKTPSVYAGVGSNGVFAHVPGASAGVITSPSPPPPSKE